MTDPLPSDQTPGPDHAVPAPSWPARARKFLVGAAGLAASLTTCEALHDTAAGPWVGIAVALATAAGIYQVPNARST